MKINTSRFGEIEVDTQAIISVPGGLIGFPEQEQYVLVRHSQDSPFYWLQAAENPDLAFVIIDPQVFKPDYRVAINKTILTYMQAADETELSIFVIVTIPPGKPEAMTANLLGPVVINTQARVARQLVLDESNYSHRHPIMAAQSRDEAGKKGARKKK